MFSECVISHGKCLRLEWKNPTSLSTQITSPWRFSTLKQSIEVETIRLLACCVVRLAREMSDTASCRCIYLQDTNIMARTKTSSLDLCSVSRRRRRNLVSCTRGIQGCICSKYVCKTSSIVFGLRKENTELRSTWGSEDREGLTRLSTRCRLAGRSATPVTDLSLDSPGESSPSRSRTKSSRRSSGGDVSLVSNPNKRAEWT
jgi:hypothetical protein